MFKEYLHKFQYFFFSKEMKSLERESSNRRMINLADAKRIGIIFDATIVHNTTAVAELATLLKAKNKKVEILGYTEEVHIAEEKDQQLFNKKNLNWKLIPNKENVTEFIDTEFDILICAFVEHVAPLEYIAACSEAKLRLGKYSDQMENCYDVMINTGEQNDIDYLLSQITKFLNIVKTK
jgi:hypothetical protein